MTKPKALTPEDGDAIRSELATMDACLGRLLYAEHAGEIAITNEE